MLSQVNGITLHDSDHYEAVDVLKGSGNDITMVVGREVIVPCKVDEEEDEEKEEEEAEVWTNKGLSVRNIINKFLTLS